MMRFLFSRERCGESFVEAMIGGVCVFFAMPALLTLIYVAAGGHF